MLVPVGMAYAQASGVPAITVGEVVSAYLADHEVEWVDWEDAETA